MCEGPWNQAKLHPKPVLRGAVGPHGEKVHISGEESLQKVQAEGRELVSPRRQVGR